MNIVLYQTDQAQNVGTIIRTAVTLGGHIHLIEPLGFAWDSAKLKRAGMDYLDRAALTRHKSWDAFMEYHQEHPGRLVAITTKGSSPMPTHRPKENDYYIFGQESCGLPDVVHKTVDLRIRIPMMPAERSMNIAVSAGMVMYHHRLQLPGSCQ